MIPGARLVLLGRQGAGKGTQCVRLVAPLRRARTSPPATCSAPPCRRAPSSAARPRSSWTPASWCPTTSWSASSTSASTSDDTTRPGLHPRRLPAHGRPGRGARRDHRPTGRSTWSSTSRCPSRSCSSASPAAGCASTAAPTTRVDAAAEVRLDVRHLRRRRRPARRRHRGGDQPPPRALRARDRAAHRLLRGAAACSTRSTASAPPTRSPTRLVAAIDDRAPRRLTCRRQVVRRSHADELADDARGRPGGGRDARRASARRSGPGVTTARARPRSAATCSTAAAPARTSSATTAIPAVICASPNDVIVHGIPGAVPPRGGRPPRRGLRARGRTPWSL